jgi:hypothetical protein
VREDFVAILNVLGQGDVAAMNGDGTFDLGKIELVGYPFVNTDKPFAIVDTAVRLHDNDVDDVNVHMMMGDLETMD